ncbi:hypothetical protein PHLGIDRAFT_28135 [Phlebiopsis gigantea 11061_1 CR5-6]|uniref:Mediator of RNA polymerase II transcription subunit 19 n=1 Tax=Phlebiopsis gigantea (strain 11061_1 CR5-6) TaxID=745531 RepID=A0A0C3PTS9_PHLG1|nr:hypothetical protein PHLGIDRAFT_28135 [Phlebiopsis gigantea 11061_1 CR5-6]
MDVDEQQTSTLQRPQSPRYNLQPTNALAGPSSQPDHPPLPQIFLLPPPEHPPPRPYFDSTQDLLSRFQLLSAFDKYVKPYSLPVGAPGSTQIPQLPTSGERGKGKEREVPPRDIASPVAGHTPGAGNDGDDEDAQGKGEKKWKNSYKHLIKGIPGKHSTKKDDYLMTMMQIPPKQRIHIQPFDLRTQRDAFSVSLDGLKGWNIGALVGDSPQAKEDRKRRKELKKLAKTQGQPGTILPGVGTPSGAPATPGATATPTSVNTLGRAGTPRPGLVLASQPQQAAQPTQPGHAPIGIGTPRINPSSTTSVTTAPPVPSARHTPIPTPAPTPGTGAPVDGTRGLKREREDSVGQINGGSQGQGQLPGVTVVTNGRSKPPPAMMNAKAGNAGVRPRPIKKQRVDVQGQAREIPVQQPTPHA